MKTVLIATLASAFALTAVVSSADAQPFDHHHHRRVCTMRHHHRICGWR